MIKKEARPDPKYEPVPTMEFAVVLTVLGNRSPSIENPAGSVAETRAPRKNLMSNITANEEVVAEMTVLRLKAMTAPHRSFLRLTLSTRRPMKIPAIA